MQGQVLFVNTQILGSNFDKRSHFRHMGSSDHIYTARYA